MAVSEAGRNDREYVAELSVSIYSFLEYGFRFFIFQMQNHSKEWSQTCFSLYDVLRAIWYYGVFIQFSGHFISGERGHFSAVRQTPSKAPVLCVRGFFRRGSTLLSLSGGNLSILFLSIGDMPDTEEKKGHDH